MREISAGIFINSAQQGASHTLPEVRHSAILPGRQQPPNSSALSHLFDHEEGQRRPISKNVHVCGFLWNISIERWRFHAVECREVLTAQEAPVRAFNQNPAWPENTTSASGVLVWSLVMNGSTC